MSANPNNRFFLARNQHIFGPLSASEVESLEQSGQLAAYTWIFKEGDSHWTPIDPPPAIPGTHGELTLPKLPPTAKAAPALRLVQNASVPQEAYRVVLFDQRNAISGWLSGANEGGCEILSDQNGPDPLFVIRETAFLSLHDTRSGETIKLRVRISSVARQPGGRGWSYRTRWDALPSLLSPSKRGESHEVAA